MFNLRAQFCASLTCLFALSAPASSAVVSVLDSGPANGTAVDLSVNDFERIGACGEQGSVINDGCSVVVKHDPTAYHASGRFTPPPGNYWIDSQDIDLLQWTVSPGKAFISLTFALTDAFDQVKSHFNMSVLEGREWVSVWEISERQLDANLHWLRVDFDAPMTEAQFKFSTRLNDGYGISSLSVELAPVPVPSAAIFLISGAAAFAGLMRSRRSACKKTSLS